jgi:hypothetical protein
MLEVCSQEKETVFTELGHCNRGISDTPFGSESLQIEKILGALKINTPPNCFPRNPEETPPVLDFLAEFEEIFGVLQVSL